MLRAPSPYPPPPALRVLRSEMVPVGCVGRATGGSRRRRQLLLGLQHQAEKHVVVCDGVEHGEKLRARLIAALHHLLADGKERSRIRVTRALQVRLDQGLEG